MRQPMLTVEENELLIETLNFAKEEKLRFSKVAAEHDVKKELRIEVKRLENLINRIKLIRLEQSTIFDIDDSIIKPSPKFDDEEFDFSSKVKK